MRRIPFLEPEFPDPALIAKDYEAITRRHLFTNSGPVEAELELALGRAIGEGVHVSLVSSGTMGLQLAMKACFRAERRFVLTPSFTFAAGALCAKWCGFEPVFIDIESGSWQPSHHDARAFLERQGGQTAGILLCNTFGVANARIAEWETLAASFEVPMVIDSAAGFGAAYAWDERIGARGSCEVFSLHATKTLGIGEGGAVSSRDAQVVTAIDQLKNFGFDADRGSAVMGTNGKLPELSAAIGLRQLDQLEMNLARRQEVFAAYRAGLEPLGCSLQELAHRSALAFASALFPSPEARDRTLPVLDERGIEVRTYYHPPVHRQALFCDALVVGDLAVTEDVCRRIVSLPMSMSLTDLEVSRVVDAVRDGIEADGQRGGDWSGS